MFAFISVLIFLFSHSSNHLMAITKRLNGFQYPLGLRQVCLVFLYIISTAAYFVIINTLIQNVQLLNILLVIHSILVFIVSMLWYNVETINTEDFAFGNMYSIEENKKCEKAIKKYLNISISRVVLDVKSCGMSNPRSNKSHYCSECKKSVVGLDHHCTWLNTCIGMRNYRPFYALLLCSTCQFSLQSCFGMLFQFYYQSQAIHRFHVLFRLEEWAFYFIVSFFTAVSSI